MNEILEYRIASARSKMRDCTSFFDVVKKLHVISGIIDYGSHLKPSEDFVRSYEVRQLQ